MALCVADLTSGLRGSAASFVEASFALGRGSRDVRPLANVPPEMTNALQMVSRTPLHELMTTVLGGHREQGIHSRSFRLK